MRLNPIDPSQRKKKRVKVNDDKYLAWLRKQPSAFSGQRHVIQACHFRTAENSGMGIKPLFCAIPLTAKEHAEQHRIGTFKFASREWWMFNVHLHQLRFIADGGKIPTEYLVRGI